MYIYIQCYRIDSFEPLKIKWRGYVVAFYEPSLGVEYDPNVNFSKGSNFDENYIYVFCHGILRSQFVLEIDISSCLFSSTFICRGKNDYTGWLYSKQIWNLLTAVATGFPYDGRLLWYLWQGSLKSPSSKSQRGGGTSLPSATSPGQACKQFLSGVPKCLYSVQIYTTSAF